MKATSHEDGLVTTLAFSKLMKSFIIPILQRWQESFGFKLTQEYYLISKSKYQALMDGMKLLNPVDFERPFEIICINRSDFKYTEGFFLN